MRNTERFARLLAGDTAIDRTPVIEWASWWDLTYKNWFQQGLPQMSPEELNVYWGHDPLKQFWLPVIEEGCPQPDHFGGPIIEDEEDYKRVHKYLFTDRLLEQIDKNVGDYARAHADEDIAYWFSLDGFFWFPRRLFGIEGHLLAFYDYPELMLEINRDLCEFHKKCLKVLFSRIKPLFMTFGEDMSYNLGPMLSKECYDEFMLPFYKELVPLIKAGGTKVLIDTDGQVEPLIPWFLEGGIEGILPLERMAGVDVNRIREKYPELIMIGGYDKTVMHKGEAAIRAEFERILPAIRSGRYIPSVDHQTPPAVSVEDYKLYMSILREYSQKIGK
ncbi:MAG: uroporphyrinogen decarboxylase family protein [Eubacteriales bacterium]|nr:uroporphyrinogen decarboxylase family protein [Eubacteriales bacterium]MDY2601439.1 uroporphyrinogen decarboxylase family protein [Eubacteriales bacterium]